ncbi:FtsX-like permease family protein [Streptococcus loxodontisalivarius]|uniref:ABC transport system permease protein n=1 Tax=Streptococcus loxodontisalivarius TaxID=1349415 RepID=A0ABS2PTH3_9STRE|nr:FtsX-like permease family protein [Streptococcus loxodontisalivarius]MBM7643353.1 putative ABC transport system permease protein [Streptococcus loxodontisalivarius]
MSKRIYWKDIRQSFTSSKGRFLSIFSLMAIGSMALVGLKVTPLNMEKTAQSFINTYNMADMVVMSDYGLDSADVKELDSIKDADVEYGYQTDVTIKDSTDAVCVFSATDSISKYKLVSGKLPTKSTEIALASNLSSDYKVGDKISFTQSSDGILKETTFTITGFVDSSELWDSSSLGSSTVGTGTLTAYAVTSASAFDSDVYTIARISYDDLDGVDYYSQTYESRLEKHQEALDDMLEDNGSARLASIKVTQQAEIDKQKANLASAENQLKTATQQAQQSQNASLLAQVQAQAKTLSEQKASLETAQKELDSLAEPTYTAYTRTSMPGGEGYRTYDSSTSSISGVGNLFPVVLYIVAAMVTLTTMTRFVDEERNNAGILKALGYTNRQIIAKFVLYGLAASLTGTLVGILAGNVILSPQIGNIIAASSVIGSSNLYFYPFWNGLALVLSLLSAVLPAYLVACRELRDKPAQLLQAKPPVSGSKILLERLTFIWKRLSFTHKVTARNIFRYKQRMLMTIFGVAGSVALLFAGLGIQSSISGVATTQFQDLIKYDMIVAENSSSSQTDLDKLSDALSSSKIKQSQAVQYISTSQSLNGSDQDVSIMVTPTKNISDYMILRDRSSKENLSLTDSGAVISEKLADLYGAKVGDTIKMTINDKTVKVKVAGITELYAGHFVYMTKAYYEDVTESDYSANAYLIKLKDSSSKNINNLASDFLDLDAVTAVVQNTSLIKQLNTVADSLQSVMLILVVLSVVLAIVILYNLTNINVAERLRELSTIKVLGFHNKEVTMYIYRETIVLSLVGILTGLLGGFGLHKVILSMIGSDSIMFNPSVDYYVYLVPILAITLILIVLGWFVNHTLRKVDMLEALKSVE